MSKAIRTIIGLIVLGAIVFIFRDPLAQIFSSLQNKYLPCQKPIEYSLGSFDERFGISKEEFLRVVKVAENTWEKSIDRELFEYAPDGDLKINLIYDIRQEATEKLKSIGITVEDTKASYNDLRSKYSVMQADYIAFKNKFETEVTSFKNRQSAYEKEVEYWNKNGGASKEDYTRLNNEKNNLDTEFTAINKLQTELNSKVNNINALVVVLNRLVESLNLVVKKFNTIGGKLGGEFEEGTYQEDASGRRIDIYQFDTEGKLARVLTHEFGHALGLGHLEDPKAVMYRLNNGINEKLTEQDVLALKQRCGIISE